MSPKAFAFEQAINASGMRKQGSAPALPFRLLRALMPVGRHVRFRRGFNNVLAMKNEKTCKHDDDRADKDLPVRQLAEENVAKDDRPEQQAVLQGREQGCRREL